MEAKTESLETSTEELQQETGLDVSEQELEISESPTASGVAASMQEQTPSQSSTTRQMPQPKDLVSQGVSFLSGLAEVLKLPEATAQLVDSLVEKDEKTGETSIRIPVESKATVSNLLNLIGKLFVK